MRCNGLERQVSIVIAFDGDAVRADCPVHRLCHVDPRWCHARRDIASGRRGCQLLDGRICQPFTFRQHRELADRAGNYLLDDGWARCADMDTRLAVRSFRVAGNCCFPDSNARLDLLQLGEETAASFGVEVESSKRMLALTAAILVGAAVAVAGLIGFVGLLVPHGVRLILGPSNRALLPASALAGGAFLVLCDLVARTIHPPTEIRLGIVTALCGGPLFIYLLLRQYRGVANS